MTFQNLQHLDLVVAKIFIGDYGGYETYGGRYFGSVGEPNYVPNVTDVKHYNKKLAIEDCFYWVYPVWKNFPVHQELLVKSLWGLIWNKTRFNSAWIYQDPDTKQEASVLKISYSDLEPVSSFKLCPKCRNLCRQNCPDTKYFDKYKELYSIQ
jgi:hypothetical protein